MSEPDPQKAEDQERRSREIADAMRRYLVAINSGAIVILLGLAGVLTSECVPPGWAVGPVAGFVGALLLTGYSLDLAKRKALARRDAYREGKRQPDFDTLLKRNQTWEAFALISFIGGVSLSLYNIHTLVLPVVTTLVCS